MEEISLQEIFFILRDRFKTILIITVITIVLAGLLSFVVIDPEYQAQTTLMIGTPNYYQMGENDLLINQRFVRTYLELAKNRNISEQVIDNLDLDISTKAFRDKVSINQIQDSELITIEVVDNDPVLATEIAKEIASVSIENVSEIMMFDNVQVVDEAQVPSNPIGQGSMLLNIAIAAVLGLMLGVFVVFLQEYLDRTIKTPEDVEKHLELSVIGAVPNEDSGEINLENPQSAVTESFRNLRTNIQYLSSDMGLKTIVVTSSIPNEGKSNIALNLARIFAEADKKILLIDCNLRKPNLHKMLEISNNNGLSNILLEDMKLEDVVHVTEGLDNLQIITSGPIPEKPAELLGSKQMQDFIEEAKNDFDMILLDTPAVGMVTDSVTLSTATDGTIFVSSVNQTNIEDAVRSKEKLDKVDTNIIGVILNKIPIKGPSSSRYSYLDH